MQGRSRDAAYWRRRIEREHPGIAERLNRGEIPSVRAAAIAAGMIHDPSGLMQLRRAWRRASPEDRAAFMAEVGVAELVPHGRRQRRKRPAAEEASEFGDLFTLPPRAEPQHPRPELVPFRGSAALSLEAPSPAPRMAPARPAVEVARLVARPEPSAPPEAAVPEAVVPEAVVPESALPETAAGLASTETPEPAREEIQQPAREPQDATSPGAAAPSVAAQASLQEAGKPRYGMRRLLGISQAKEGHGGNGAHASEVSETAGGRVKVGQRYLKVDAGPTAWQVVSIFAGPLGMPHVRIVNVEEPDTLRAVSVSALVDRGRYQLVR